jgi:hypothetical protein
MQLGEQSLGGLRAAFDLSGMPGIESNYGEPPHWGHFQERLLESLGDIQQIPVVVRSLEGTDWPLLPVAIDGARTRWNGSMPPGVRFVLDALEYPRRPVDAALRTSIEDIRERYDFATKYYKLLKLVGADVEFIRDQKNLYPDAVHNTRQTEAIEGAVMAMLDAGTVGWCGYKAAIIRASDAMCALDAPGIAVALEQALVDYKDWPQASLKALVAYRSWYPFVRGNLEAELHGKGFFRAVQNWPFAEVQGVDLSDTMQHYGNLKGHVTRVAQCFVDAINWGDPTMVQDTWGDDALRARFQGAAWYFLENLSGVSGAAV